MPCNRNRQPKYGKWATDVDIAGSVSSQKLCWVVVVFNAEYVRSETPVERTQALSTIEGVCSSILNPAMRTRAVALSMSWLKFWHWDTEAVIIVHTGDKKELNKERNCAWLCGSKRPKSVML